MSWANRGTVRTELEMTHGEHGPVRATVMGHVEVEAGAIRFVGYDVPVAYLAGPARQRGEFVYLAAADRAELTAEVYRMVNDDRAFRERMMAWAERYEDNFGRSETVLPGRSIATVGR